MNAETPALPPPPTSEPPPPPPPPDTPWTWRAAIAGGIVVLVGLAYTSSYLLSQSISERVQAFLGILCFIGVVGLFSKNLRTVNWRTIGWGVALQVLLVLFVLKLSIPWTDANGETIQVRPGYEVFSFFGRVITQFLNFTADGSKMVFGVLSNQPGMEAIFGKGNGFVFAFMALPTIIFVSAFFALLYHYGILQLVVRGLARVMMYLMRTSGAETLSVGANVFMGQTEAPLIVKPYIGKMTESELLTMMVGGMAHISGGMMAVYIGLGADPVAILATSVMAVPCSLYLSKLLLPELGQPETSGLVHVKSEKLHSSGIDAFATGASDGLFLALNVAAMLIAFLAGLAMLDFLLNLLGVYVFQMPDKALSLAKVFGWVFSPVAFLLGIQGADVTKVAELLGFKLAANEFIAYLTLKGMTAPAEGAAIGRRAHRLATYALTGFANFGSIGIQLGGIGAMAPHRRKDLAKLAPSALFVGFVATLVNASLAGLLMDE